MVICCFAVTFKIVNLLNPKSKSTTDTNRAWKSIEIIFKIGNQDGFIGKICQYANPFKNVLLIDTLCSLFFCAAAVDHVVIGTVIQEVKTSNIAREVNYIIL